jgi:hypothetical protein
MTICSPRGKGHKQAKGLSLALQACVIVSVAFAPGVVAAAQDPPLFALHAADGTTAAGPVMKIDRDWSVRLGGTNPFLTPGSDVITLRRQGQPLPRLPVGEQVVLSNGDRLVLEPGAALRMSAERLECAPLTPVRVPRGSPLTFPIAAVALVWLTPPDGMEDSAMFQRRLVAERRTRDVVILRNGDRIEGTVLALARSTQEALCRLEVNRKPVEIPLARVAAVAFSTDLLALPRFKGTYAHLVLANGGRLALASAEFDPRRQTVMAKMLLGPRVEMPLADVAALDLRNGRAIYLADLQLRSYQHAPFLGIAWPLGKDVSVAGRELRLAGSTYDKGLGLHARSVVTYDLAGRYEWFEALVGLDDATGRHGQASIRVSVDAKVSDLGWETLTAKNGPVPVRVRVHGARSLRLVVDFGPQGDVQSHVDWADARLIK